MKRIFLILLVIVFASSSFAQLSDVATLEKARDTRTFGIKPVSSLFSLIDMSKIRFSNSYSVSFFSSGSNSGSLGMLNSNMFYDFSKKLTVGINLSLFHNPNSIFDRSANANESILPGFMIDYHPSKNFNLRIDYRSQDRNLYQPYYRSNYIR